MASTAEVHRWLNKLRVNGGSARSGSFLFLGSRSETNRRPGVSAAFGGPTPGPSLAGRGGSGVADRALDVERGLDHALPHLGVSGRRHHLVRLAQGAKDPQRVLDIFVPRLVDARPGRGVVTVGVDAVEAARQHSGDALDQGQIRDGHEWDLLRYEGTTAEAAAGCG